MIFRLGGLAAAAALQSRIAIVAELADAHGSGPCTGNGVGVRVPSMAPALSSRNFFLFLGGLIC
jgi:hypothetical protein